MVMINMMVINERWEETTTSLNFYLFTFLQVMRKVGTHGEFGKTFSMSMNSCSFHVPVVQECH